MDMDMDTDTYCFFVFVTNTPCMCKDGMRCAVPTQKSNAVICPCYIIFRVSTRQWSGSARDALRHRPGITATLPNGKDIDNSWIVSYNIYLMLKYACHINVVVCTSMSLMKYLYKCNFKGGDRAMLSLGVPGQDGQPAPPQDEITEFEDL
jgi:hypothetical protein